MTDTASNLTFAATAVMKALEPLAEQDRERVIRSAAALYGIGLAAPAATQDGAESSDGNIDEEGDDRSNGGKQLSLVEFLRQKEPATHSQYIAAFAYYREHVEGKGTTFSSADLRHYFSTAKLAKPTHYSREWDVAVRQGWIHDAGASSYLTQGGEEKVRAGFGGKGRPRGPSAAKKVKRGVTKASGG